MEITLTMEHSRYSSKTLSVVWRYIYVQIPAELIIVEPKLRDFLFCFIAEWFR